MIAAIRGLAVAAAVDQQHRHKSVSGCGYRSTTIKTGQQHNELSTGVPATRTRVTEKQDIVAEADEAL